VRLSIISFLSLLKYLIQANASAQTAIGIANFLGNFKFLTVNNVDFITSFADTFIKPEESLKLFKLRICFAHCIHNDTVSDIG
jgi:hypothetical protein